MTRALKLLVCALAAAFTFARPVATAQTSGFMQYYNFVYAEFCYGTCKVGICCGVVAVR